MSNRSIKALKFVLFIMLLASNNLAWSKESSDNIKTTDNITQSENKTPATQQKSVTQISVPVNNATLHKTDLEHYLTHDEVKPLLAGPDDYITLFKKNTSPNTKGIVILIPEWQQGATNPKAINYLRNTLPLQGWSTLAVQPNDKPINFPSTALTITEQKKENELILAEYKRKLSTLFNAVINTAKDSPGIVLVIAQGNNAALLVDILSEDESQQPNAIVLLSSYRQSSPKLSDSVNNHFAKQLAYTELPVLDLYLKHDNSTVLAKAPQRNLIAKQEMKTYYRQRQLNNSITGYYPEKELLRQINSWLKAIGW